MPRDETRADLKEFYHFAQAHYDQPNCEDVPDFVTSGKALYGRMEALAGELLKAVAISSTSRTTTSPSTSKAATAFCACCTTPRHPTRLPMRRGRAAMKTST